MISQTGPWNFDLNEVANLNASDAKKYHLRKKAYAKKHKYCERKKQLSIATRRSHMKKMEDTLSYNTQTNKEQSTEQCIHCKTFSVSSDIEDVDGIKICHDCIEWFSINCYGCHGISVDDLPYGWYSVCQDCRYENAMARREMKFPKRKFRFRRKLDKLDNLQERRRFRELC